jgi:2-methylaconitate cis-trans-isomerase PrpF
LRVASRIRTGANGETLIESAQIERTARLIMDGTLFVRRRKIEMLTAASEKST